MKQAVGGGLLLFLLWALTPSLGWAQGALENPPDGSHQSGIGIVSGWKCTAGNLTFTIDGGPPAQLAYGISRADTQGTCGHSNTGFIAEENWNLAGNGQHTIRVYDNGQQFAQATFTVTTLGTEFLTGAEGTCTVPNFPQAGTEVTLQWQESTQNFVITAVTTGVTGSFDGKWSGRATSAVVESLGGFDCGGAL